MERWPNWLRWLLFIPAAFLAMIAMHLVITIAFSGNENQASIFGVEVEGPTAQSINSFKYNVLARICEPWAFVAAGGIVAPGQMVPAIVLAVFIVLLHLAAPAIYLISSGPSSTAGVALLRAAMGIIGAIAGIASAWRYKDKS